MVGVDKRSGGRHVSVESRCGKGLVLGLGVEDTEDLINVCR